MPVLEMVVYFVVLNQFLCKLSAFVKILQQVLLRPMEDVASATLCVNLENVFLSSVLLKWKSEKNQKTR